MKGKKLNLGDLKVKSFVTNMEAKAEKTVKGGLPPTIPLCASVNANGCTLGACFSVGPHCTYAQIC